MERGEEAAWSSALPPSPCFADVHARRTQRQAILSTQADPTAAGVFLRMLRTAHRACLSDETGARVASAGEALVN